MLRLTTWGATLLLLQPENAVGALLRSPPPTMTIAPRANGQKTAPAKEALATAAKVNAWTEWGTLRATVVGHATDACFPHAQPGFMPSINLEGGSGAKFDGSLDGLDESYGAGAIIQQEIGWPIGPKKASTIAAANAQLDNLARVLAERGVEVSRPDTIDWKRPIRTPHFESPTQYCATCPRDVLATVGNIVVEASMSRRDRYFEVHSVRSIVRKLWRDDPNMLWKAAPKPSMEDDMYKPTWWDYTLEERYARMHMYDFAITNEEPIFDAADIMRCGRDLFVQLSATCNNAGIDWLRRELRPHGMRVHRVRFPYDLAPSHLDCTFVPLKPGLVLTNPERPILEEDAALFKANGWRFIDAPQPNNPSRPWASQSSKWLSMNVLSISPTCIVAEEQETALHELLESEGFEVIKVPFRAVYEFGGGLHCATWDTLRDDDDENLFPERPEGTDGWERLRGGFSAVGKFRGGASENAPSAAKMNADETGYAGLASRQEKQEWVGIKADASEERLDIDGHPVMQAWEAPYMASLAAVASSKGGRVLEVGFGMGISAGAIQSYDAVAEHLIIEANSDVYKSLLKFAETSRRPVTPLGPALWQDALDQVPDGSLDGILYDTYPLSVEEQHTHQFEFLKRARSKLRAGGVLTYCNLTSLGVLKGRYESWEDLFNETQRPNLLAAGWKEEEISFSTAETAPPADCEYYAHTTGLVPILTKQQD
jgi:glycine amidinotransferase